MNLISSWSNLVCIFIVFCSAFWVLIQCGKGKKKVKGKGKKAPIRSGKQFVNQNKSHKPPSFEQEKCEVTQISNHGSNVVESDVGTRTNSISADSQEIKYQLPAPPPLQTKVEKKVAIQNKVEKINKQQFAQKPTQQSSEAFYEKCDDLTPAPLLNLCALQAYKKE